MPPSARGAAGGGWTLLALDPSRRTLSSLPGLSEEAMWAHLGALGAAPPLLVHRPRGGTGASGAAGAGGGAALAGSTGRDAAADRDFAQRAREAMGLPARAAAVRRFSSPGGGGGDAAGAFAAEALLALGMRPDTPVTRLEVRRR